MGARHAQQRQEGQHPFFVMVDPLDLAQDLRVEGITGDNNYGFGGQRIGKLLLELLNKFPLQCIKARFCACAGCAKGSIIHQ